MSNDLEKTINFLRKTIAMDGAVLELYKTICGDGDIEVSSNYVTFRDGRVTSHVFGQMATRPHYVLFHIFVKDINIFKDGWDGASGTYKASELAEVFSGKIAHPTGFLSR